MEERPYQQITVRRAEWAMRAGKRTLIVCPTGGGKTEIASLLIRRYTGTVGWATHTKDLVDQTAERLSRHGLRVGIVAAGHPVDPFARVQVASIQTLVAREAELRCSMLVLDEAHHFLATDWRAAWERTSSRYMLGLTATPERGDGQPLGDIFDELIVAAHYSELIEGGYIVPLRVLRPSSELDRGLAKKVVPAYLEHGEGRSGFVFVPRIKDAEELAHEARGAGVPSAVVEAETDKELRRSHIARLAAGDLRLLFNVRALTEGVDVPGASLCLLGKNFMHVGGLLQAAGRVLRPAPGKTDGLLLDLMGVTHRLGVPTEDRAYSLDGEGIRRTAKGESLHVCMDCGCTYPSGGPCPRCGSTPPVVKAKPLRIYNKELEAVYAAGSTPAWAKRAELDRLRSVAATRGLSLAWVRIEYEKLFGEKPTLSGEESDTMREEFDRLLKLAKEKGYSTGWAQHRYNATFGSYPPRTWVPA